MQTLEAPGTHSLMHHQVTGGGGAKLHVVETGNRGGRPILFLHGFSQSWLSWRRQLESDLAEDYRLVAMDLRGHGQSDKPQEGYSDCILWADDVNAIIRDLKLSQPVLCGWSYGSIVFLDYLRQYGQAATGGLVFVDGISKLGSDAALAVLTPELLTLVPGLFSTDVQDSVQALECLLRLCFVRQPAAEDLYLMLGCEMVVPPSVRQALFSRSFDNDDLLPRITKPVLIVHGAEDAIVKNNVVDQHAAGVPHAQVRLMPNAGHAPFWDDPKRFNKHIRAFCETL